MVAVFELISHCSQERDYVHWRSDDMKLQFGTIVWHIPFNERKRVLRDRSLVEHNQQSAVDFLT